MASWQAVIEDTVRGMGYELVEIDKRKTEDEEIRRVIDQMQAERNARFAHPIAQLPAPLDGERDSIRNGRSTLAPSLRKPYLNRRFLSAISQTEQLSMVLVSEHP